MGVLGLVKDGKEIHHVRRTAGWCWPRSSSTTCIFFSKNASLVSRAL